MPERSPTVAVVGTGYVGLTTAVCFAERGFHVVGVEVDAGKLHSLSKGVSTIHEPMVPRLLARAVASKRIRFVGSIHEAGETDFVFITVQTPSKADGSIDLSFIVRAAREVGAHLKNDGKYRVVVAKSTAVPGTTMDLLKPVLETASRTKLGAFGLGSNPEFLREGRAVEDTFRPDKVVIGGADARSAEALLSLYRRLYGTKMPRIILTTPSNAEMVKYASNSFLSMKVSYINQMARLCAAVPGCDVEVVADAIGVDRRIGRRFLDAGLGFGGSCFSKDLRALRNLARKMMVPVPLVDATLQVNEEQAMAGVGAIEAVLGTLGGKRMAVLGLAFKPETDDVRDAVSLRLIPILRRSGARVVAYDPVAGGNARKVIPDLRLATSAEACIRGADCAIVVTEWDEFRKLKPSFFKRHMKAPFVFDGRRIYDPAAFKKAGVKYRAVGLSSS